MGSATVGDEKLMLPLADTLGKALLTPPLAQPAARVPGGKDRQGDTQRPGHYSPLPDRALEGVPTGFDDPHPPRTPNAMGTTSLPKDHLPYWDGDRSAVKNPPGTQHTHHPLRGDGPDRGAVPAALRVRSQVTVIGAWLPVCGGAAHARLRGLDVGHEGIVGEPGRLLMRVAGVLGHCQAGPAAPRSGRWPPRRRCAVAAPSCSWPRAPAGRCHRRWPAGPWPGRPRSGGTGPAGAVVAAGPGGARHAWCSSISPALRAQVPQRQAA